MDTENDIGCNNYPYGKIFRGDADQVLVLIRIDPIKFWS